jgi:signal transduction histidine kinase
MGQIDRLRLLGYSSGEEMVRYQKMLLWEGGTLIFSLIVGGLTLAYFMYRELRQRLVLHDFFIAFSHDLKTALATVLLQSEMIRERFDTAHDKELGDRFIADIGKLALQLSNALAVSQLQDRVQYKEPISVAELVLQLQSRFQNLQISMIGDEIIRVDRGAFETVLGNLAQNAVTHGGATELSIRVVGHKDNVQISVSDNGRGFHGSRRKLGQRFFRHYTGSGSGLGLYLSIELLKTMDGRIEFPETPQGFCVEIFVPKNTT